MAEVFFPYSLVASVLLQMKLRDRTEGPCQQLEM